MGWKFWQKSDASGSTSQPSPSIDLPTEAYASLRLLAAVYARDVYPFTEWHATEYPIEWDLESLFRRTVKAHQLNVWFSVYLLQRGEVEAKMLRDAFPHVMDELFPNEGMRDRIHNLLEAQACAVDYFMTLSEEERAAAMNPTALESTSQWHFAFYLLVFNPDSPFVEPEEVPDGQQHALAACLEKASSEAQAAFTPMLQAINRFDAAKLPAWEWSQTMGAHERHLQRRFRNPLFPRARRLVTVSDVYSARILDAKDYEEASQALQSIGQELADFQLTRDWNVTLSQKKTQLEGLLYRIAGMDRRGDDLKSKAEILVGHVVGYSFVGRWPFNSGPWQVCMHPDMVAAACSRRGAGVRTGERRRSQLAGSALPVAAQLRQVREHDNVKRDGCRQNWLGRRVRSAGG
jgi:hypothetical protein